MPPSPSDRADLVSFHERLGWWGLFAFAAIGLVLEALHGFKVQAYLSVASETRRLVLTLGHAHGALLALVHLAFASALARDPARFDGLAGASRWLTAALVLLPGGFLAGAFGAHGGDPGPAVALVPVGGVALLVGLARVARNVATGRPSPKPPATTATTDRGGAASSPRPGTVDAAEDAADGPA
ncbi:MAG: hypothetical protein D6705_05565 [Deltaproteobacteria bacterium]|nr:MAG: hypothetical protein D6705_05565 [Deltaproteobacteria bacterium]